MVAPLLTPEERRQAAALHHKNVLGEPLTEADEALVSRFYGAVEAEESARLRPEAAEQEHRLASLESQVRDMEALVAREAALVERLRALLSEVTQERRAIQHEKQRILTQSPPTR